MEPIVFAGLNWETAQLQNHIARFILENGYGYPTLDIPGSAEPLYESLFDGSVQVLMESWLPNHQPFWDRATEEGLALPAGKSLDDNWQDMFTVPTYMIEGDPVRGIEALAPNLKTLQDIRKYKDIFPQRNGKIALVSCAQGWTCEHINRSKLEAYGLDDIIEIHQPESSEEMTTSLTTAYEKGEPWLGYTWGPRWIISDLKLTPLKEPDCDGKQGPETGCAYDDAKIRIMMSPDLIIRAPEVFAFFLKWDFNKPTQFVAEECLEQAGEEQYEAAAVCYLKDQQAVWISWVPADVFQRVRSALDIQ